MSWIYQARKKIIIQLCAGGVLCLGFLPQNLVFSLEPKLYSDEAVWIEVGVVAADRQGKALAIDSNTDAA